MATGFAHELRRLRIEQDMRRDSVADRAGVSRLTLRRIEKGESFGQPKTIAAVAMVLGADLEPLLELRGKAIRNRAKTLRRKLNGPMLMTLLVVLALMVAVEAVDLVVPRSDWGFPPTLGHPLRHPLDALADAAWEVTR